MRWGKSVPSNLFQIAGIPVDLSSDKSDCICKWYWSHCQNT